MDPLSSVNSNAQLILASLDPIRQKVIDVFSSPGDTFIDSSDPDRMLYSGGFFSPADRHLMKKMLVVPPGNWGDTCGRSRTSAFRSCYFDTGRAIIRTR